MRAGSHSWTMVGGYRTAEVTIPAAGSAVSVWELVAPHMDDDQQDSSVVAWFVIDAQTKAGTDRVAINVGHAPGEVNAFVPEAQPWEDPCRDPSQVFVEAPAGASTATVRLAFN